MSYTDNILNVYETNLMNDELFQEIVMLPYTFTRTDAPPTVSHPNVELAGMYWTHQFYNFTPIDDPDYFQNAGIDGSNNNLYLDILSYLEAKLPNLPPREDLYSSYINVLRYGNSPGIHVDAPYYVPENKTVLVYLNPIWQPDWGGETIFFDDDLDSKRLVQPRAGRVVLFDGRIPHTGTTGNIRFLYNRYVLTYKYMQPDIRQKLFTDYEMTNKPPVEDRNIAGFNPNTVKTIWEKMWYVK